MKKSKGSAIRYVPFGHFFVLSICIIYGFSEHSLSRERVSRGVCDYIATMPTEQLDLYKYVLLGGYIDINNDGDIEQISQGDSGQAGPTLFEIKGTNGEVVYPKKIEHEYKDYGADWNAVLPYQNSYFLIYYKRQSDHQIPLYTTYLNANNEEHQVCEFDYRKELASREDYSDIKMCDDWYNNKETKNIDFNIKSEIADSYGPWETYLGNIGKFDFDNDGNDEYLQKVFYDSGRGAGCSFVYYDLLDNTLVRPREGSKRFTLLNLQGVTFSETGHFSSIQCGSPNVVNNWFTLQKSNYFEINNHFRRQVHIFTGDKVEKSCDYKFRPIVTVKNRVN